jgi:hypothetical protein
MALEPARWPPGHAKRLSKSDKPPIGMSFNNQDEVKSEWGLFISFGLSLYFLSVSTLLKLTEILRIASKSMQV